MRSAQFLPFLNFLKKGAASAIFDRSLSRAGMKRPPRRPIAFFQKIPPQFSADTMKSTPKKRNIEQHAHVEEDGFNKQFFSKLKELTTMRDRGFITQEKFDEMLVDNIAEIQGRNIQNLNKQKLFGNGLKGGQTNLIDYSFSDIKDIECVSVHFRDLESNIIRYIKNADIVVGCVAWLRSFPILNSLKEKVAVSIVVQKEEFLRPDYGEKKDYSNRHLHEAYNSLPPLYRTNKATSEAIVLRTNTMDSEAEPISAIRCVGFARRKNQVSLPLMHHKFLVFCRYKGICEEYEDYTGKYPSYNLFGNYGKIKPYAVWSGSYNLSKNGNNSFENALYIESLSLASAYFSEWGQVAALSEPLNWESEWVHPEYTVGTGS